MTIRDETVLVATGTLDRLGDLIRRAAIPVAIFLSTGSPLAVGAAAAVSFVPFILMIRISTRFGSPFRARSSLMAFNAARAAVSLAMAVQALQHHFGPLFYLLIFALASLTAVVDTSFGSLIRVSTDADQLPRVNARLGTWQNGVAAAVGLPLGGLLGALNPAAAFLLNGATYLLALVLVRSSRLGIGVGDSDDNAQRQVSRAISWLVHSPTHLSVLVGIIGLNLASGLVFGNLIVVAVRQFAINDRYYGLIPLVWSLSVTAGSALLARRPLAPRTLLIAAPGIQICGYVVLLLTGSLVVLGFGLVIIGLAAAGWNIASSSLMQSDPPTELVSGVLSTWKSVSLSASFAGAAIGGILLESLQTKFVIGLSAICCIASLIAVEVAGRRVARTALL